MRETNLKKLNNEGFYTLDQLLTHKRFQGKYLNTYPHHYKYWQDGEGYVTVYEIRGMTEEIRENYESPEEMKRRM